MVKTRITCPYNRYNEDILYPHCIYILCEEALLLEGKAKAFISGGLWCLMCNVGDVGSIAWPILGKVNTHAHVPALLAH